MRSPWYAFTLFASVASAAAPRGGLWSTALDRVLVSADSACASIGEPSTGTLAVTAIARVEPFKLGETIPRDFASFVVDAIATHLVLPKPLEFSVYNSTDITTALAAPSANHHVYPAFTAEFLLTLRKDGAVRKVEMTQSSLATPLDDAILAAIHAADSLHDFPPLDGVTDASTLPVFVDFDLGSGLFTNGFPVFRASVPLYPAEKAEPLRGAVPKYPDELRSRGIQGEVKIRFVVDETGKIANDSYRFLKLSDIGFGQSVLETLPRVRYKPARIGSCPIKQIVDESYQFKLDR